MREIKFRAWDSRNNQMDHPDGIANNIDGEKHGIMQYTGLKDKNGKEIYEGDIVNDGEKIWAVEWYDDGGAFCRSDIGGGPLCEYGVREAEVIGNIYENPELI